MWAHFPADRAILKRAPSPQTQADFERDRPAISDESDHQLPDRVEAQLSLRPTVAGTYPGMIIASAQRQAASVRSSLPYSNVRGVNSPGLAAL